MKVLHEFIKSTFIGGLLFVLPLGLVMMAAAKGVGAIEQVLAPIVSHLPNGLQFPTAIAAGVLIGVCLVAGLLARTRVGQNAGSFFERTVLNHVPGYALARNVVRGMANVDDHGQFAPAFVEMDEMLVPAFLVEAHADGRHTVFIPSAPTPSAGAIYVVPAGRVHLIDAPIVKTVNCITAWGVGAAALLGTVRAPSITAQANGVP